MSPVSAVRTDSDRLTAANFRRTSRDWTSSVNSAKGNGPVQDDHRQPAPLGRPAHHVRRGREGPAESEDDGRGLRAVQ